MIDVGTQTMDKDDCHQKCEQNAIVMRHGDRLDNVEPLWVSTAARPWDPPLAEAGRIRAFSTGRQIRNNPSFQINRVFVSPFLRCVQTAVEVICALCAINDDPLNMTGDGLVVDPSKVKVSIEYGLCEMMNKEAIRRIAVPKDGIWSFNISELEAMFPAGTVDYTVERVYQELPQWEETVLGAHTRYERVIRSLADKYPSENLLLVTHGEGVGVSVSAFFEGTTVYEVDYCAYSHLRRPISKENKFFNGGNFELLTNISQTGISYYPLPAITDDV